MNEHDRLLKALSYFPSRKWVNQYFDLVKRLLTDLSLSSEDPRLGLSLNTNGNMPVNIGGRYVIMPYIDEYIGCIVPTEFEESIVNGESVFQFNPNTNRDAKFISLPFPTGSTIPPQLYEHIFLQSEKILLKTKKSRFRKYHSDLLYHFTMEVAVREEILNSLNSIS